MVKFETYDFTGNTCFGMIFYDINRDAWIVKTEIPVRDFRSSDNAKKAIQEAIDDFDMKLFSIKNAYREIVDE